MNECWILFFRKMTVNGWPQTCGCYSQYRRSRSQRRRWHHRSRRWRYRGGFWIEFSISVEFYTCTIVIVSLLQLAVLGQTWRFCWFLFRSPSCNFPLHWMHQAAARPTSLCNSQEIFWQNLVTDLVPLSVIWRSRSLSHTLVDAWR